MKLYVWLDDVRDPVQLIDAGFMGIALLPQPFDPEEAEVPGWTVAELCRTRAAHREKPAPHGELAL